MIYSIVDIETTGGSHGNRITEIAICKTDGNQIIDQYQSLINPELFIPKSITLLTGITNAMVEDAPLFDDVFEEIKDFLTDTIFVAHNVSFDYSIVKNHFEDVGVVFNMKKLCTVRLARSIIPGYPSYSLGKICKSLGIINKNRHRAMGDAEATSELFHYLITEDKEDFISYSLNQLNKEATLPPNLAKEEYDNLPEKPGVYYLLGEHLKILYIGKAKNIRKRITSHFTEKSRKKSELLRNIHHVSFEETGNELVALLLESDEIKKHYPYYNKAQKRAYQNYHICHYKGQDDVLRVDVFMKKFANNSLASFSSMVMAKDHLYLLVEKHGLCPKHSGLERTKNKCYLGDNCDLCAENISVDDYNQRVLDSHENQEQLNILIVGKGRNRNEKAVVLLEEGEYKGFGYFEPEHARTKEAMLECIVRYKNNNDTSRLLKGFLQNGLSKQYEILSL